MKRLLCLLVLISSGYGKDAPIVMYWPDQINGTLKLSFTKFQPFAAGKSQTMYLSDVIVENLTGLELIGRDVFELIVTPLPLRGLEASPVRAVARVDG